MTSEHEAGGARNAAPDFTDYTRQQLEQLRDSLAPAAAPELQAALQAELVRRGTAGDATPDDEQTGVAGRYTARDGLRGWLEARSSRQPVYGSGYLRVGAQTLTLGGWQRTWLGVPVERALEYPLSRVRNVAPVGGRLHLEIVRTGWLPGRVAFTPDAGADVAALAQRLPGRASARFAARGRTLLEFENAMRLRCPVAWVTAALVLLNIAAFIAIAVSAGTAAGSAFLPLMLGFANVPGLVLNGQWWRLLSALFMHGGLLHLALNMWVLWSAGRMTERIFGSGRYVAIYLLAGIAGGLGSIAWDPDRFSVGASGAIFGVLGAFLAALVHPESRVPRAVFRGHWVPALLFVAFNLASGAMQPGTDNAAHVGGLLAGIALGLALAPARLADGRSRMVAARALAVVVLLAVGGVVLWSSGSLARPLSPHDRFVAQNQWYSDGETRNNIAWQKLGMQASAGMLSESQIAERFGKEVLPFWEDALPRLEAVAGSARGEDGPYLREIARYARIRRDTAQAVIDSVSGGKHDGEGASVESLTADAQMSLARLERITLLSRSRQLDAGLGKRFPVGIAGSCVHSPYLNHIRVADTDARDDGPALRDAAACEAQALFRKGDFRLLEQRLRSAATNPGDMPDGGSMLGALTGGLARLFTYGPDGVEKNLARIARWRRAVPDSWFVTTQESEVFSAAAWQARGGGYAREVTAQGMRLFQLRTEMARASLEECDANCRKDPGWYVSRIDVGVDRSADHDTLMQYLAESRQDHPAHFDVYSSVMRALMPRWGGSYGQVVAVVEDAVATLPENERDLRYARLVWAYADLEDEQANVFKDAGFAWDRVQRGLAMLMERYPGSDYLLNGYARLACEADAILPYQAVRQDVGRRPSATAWTLATTLKVCDARFENGGGGS